MKAIIGAIILVIVIFFAVPMIASGSTNACQALEQQKVSNTATSIAGTNTGIIHNTINTVGQAGATGDVASTAEAQSNPNTPSPISCTVDYWKTIL